MGSSKSSGIGKEGYPFNEQWLHLRVVELIAVAAALMVPGVAAGESCYVADSDSYVMSFRRSDTTALTEVALPGPAVRNPDHSDAIFVAWVAKDLRAAIRKTSRDWSEQYLKRYPRPHNG